MSDHGTAMSKLNPRQALYVEALVHRHASKAGAAAAAGYTGSADTLKATGWRLAQNPLIIAAVREECEKVLVATAGLATDTLVELCRSASHEGTRLRAACELLDRSGLVVKHVATMTVTHSASEPEKVAEITRLAGTLGLNPARLLGAAYRPQFQPQEADGPTTEGHDAQ